MSFEVKVLHAVDGGVRCEISGPGIGQFDAGRTPVLQSPDVAERLQVLLQRVYEAGRQAKAEEVLAVLGAQPARRSL